MAMRASQRLHISPSKKHTKVNSWIDCIIYAGEIRRIVLQNQKSKTKPPLLEPLPYDFLRHHGNDGGRSLELAWKGTPWYIEKERLFVQQNSSVHSAGKVAEGGLLPSG